MLSQDEGIQVNALQQISSADHESNHKFSDATVDRVGYTVPHTKQYMGLQHFIQKKENYCYKWQID